jgi:hypothetical protein
MKYKSGLLCLIFSTCVCFSMKAQMRSIDDLANSSIFLYNPLTGKDGTGTLMSTRGYYFILTAKHVVAGLGIAPRIILHLSGDKALTLELNSLCKGVKWQIHEVADLAVIQIFPIKENGFDTLLTKYNFPDSLMYSGNDLPRDLELTFFGYPVVEPGLGHFSALSFHGSLASGLITMNVPDINITSDFFFMNVPSMQGCSGSGVYYNISKPVMLGGSNKTWMIGIVTGTQSDATGGKLALITPLSYLQNWKLAFI